MTPAQASMQLALLNSQTESLDKLDTFTKLVNLDIPQEIISRLEELWDKTKSVGGQIVHIGKLIANHLINFINENSHLSVGCALGVALSVLASSIPLIGALVGPILTLISTIYGALEGFRIDRSGKVSGLSQELIAMAKKFFELLINVFRTIKGEV